MCITTPGVHECPQLLCTAKESDTRVWLHVVHSAGNKKLLFSPDTEVYHIGHLLEFQGGYVICDAIWRKIKIIHSTNSCRKQKNFASHTKAHISCPSECSRAILHIL